MEYTYEEKNPLILPTKDPLVELLVNWVHSVECIHCGSIPNVMQQLRSEHVVLGARRLVEKVLKNCTVCARYRAKPATEPTPPLPRFRVDRAAPLHRCRFRRTNFRKTRGWQKRELVHRSIYVRGDESHTP